MLKIFATVAVALALSACGTKPYQPTEYPLRDGLVPKLAVAGDVKLVNKQTSTEEAIAHSYAGTKLATSYQAITQLMVDQATKEITKNGARTPSGQSKVIDLKVTYLQSNYIAFFWKSEIRATVSLGNGQTFELVARHGSGAGPVQDLNGCIGEAVIALLKDARVTAYLAQ